MWRTPERRAWVVLLMALMACCALTVGLPVGVISFVNNASLTPQAYIHLQAGKVSTYELREQSTDAKVVNLYGRAVEEGGTIIVDADLDSVAGLTIAVPNQPVSIDLQLYSGTRLKIDKLSVPRYSISAAADLFVLSLERGRIEVQVNYPATRRLNLRITTPEATVQSTSAGQFGVSAEVSRTHVMNYNGSGSGAVQVTTANGVFARTLGPTEWVAVEHNASAIVPLAPPRNVVRNGTFTQPIQDFFWTTAATAGNNLPLGAAIPEVIGTTSVLDLKRVGAGMGPGRTSITQVLNQRVTGRQSASLRVAFAILEQEIQVCGSTGSECPLMLDVTYLRLDGSEAHWRQGFYAVGEPFDQVLPDYVVKEKQSKHIFKRLGAPAHFASGNLLQIAPDMHILKSLTLYAEGHSVHTRVRAVELWLQD